MCYTAVMEKGIRKVYRGEDITQSEWLLIDMAVKAFITKFHAQWAMFQQEMAAERKELTNPTFGDASKSQHKELHASSHRKVAVIPTFWNEIEQQEESLIMVLEKIHPYLFSNKKNTREFLKKYPDFQVPSKI